MASKTIGIRLNKRNGGMIESIRKACNYTDKSDGQILTDALDLYYTQVAAVDNKHFIKSMVETIKEIPPTYSGQTEYVLTLFSRISDVLEVLSVSNTSLLKDEFARFLFVVFEEGGISTTEPDDEVSFNDTQQYEVTWNKISLSFRAERTDDYEMDADCIETCEEISRQEAEERANKAIAEVERKIEYDLNTLNTAFYTLFPNYWEAQEK